MKLVQIPGDKAEEAWPLVQERIEDATKRSNGRFTSESILEEIKDSRQQLWVIWDDKKRDVRAVGVSQLLIYPSGLKIADVVILTGDGRKEWKHLVEEFEAWARREECGLIQMYARKGWAKELPDFRLSHVLLEKKL